uniref:Centrosomin N-terminal motif 1 domain-containing protein n=1 Tax=Serinus canaria TaxID=9135 RepID=A0A8C9NNU5_SERCA
MLLSAGTPAAVTLCQPWCPEPEAWRVRHPESPATLRALKLRIARGWPGAFGAPRRPLVSPLSSLLSSEAHEAGSSHFSRLTAARPCSLPASQEGLWGEGDEEPVPAEPRGSSGPPGAQAQPDPLGQTCLLRDLEMGPLAHTQTLRDFEKVRLRGHLNDLKKENFSLKLRIYFLEERVQQKGEDSRDDVYRRNIELKVEVESLKRELQEKQQALDNTW